ncbi:GNAT family N-acetyltransferase [Salinibacterium sp. SYSU T00001]|uniref:GNAT family N-acetyltransferase n=1 Tax=Homoserinimonas sedimenticola TaxID=2986805 RepID=UPI0022361707|nr:GNAT family N-acetyltransferase [Salinibacterium sedimenticola]MCW4386413.1 GNAT family N-acetyltransferase [Salinibacterium sedimenticola]
MTLSHIPRPAREADLPEMLRLIHDLAEYEREPDAVMTSEDDLRRALFGEHPAVFAHVVDGDTDPSEVGGELAGMAIWFLTFSTWEGVHGIHLEDLYVRERFRGRGYGRALLSTLAAICVERGYARLEWQVLDWNEPAIGFYKKLGAVPMDEWTTFRLSGDALRSQ